MDTNHPAARIAWKLRDIQRVQMAYAHHVLWRHGLHFGQPQILKAIRISEGATQKELAERLHISPASLAMSIKRMQKAGLVEKTVDENDLRQNRVRLTGKGHQIFNASFCEMEASSDEMLAGFSDDEILRLDGYLDRIRKNLERIREPEHAE